MTSETAVFGSHPLGVALLKPMSMLEPASILMLEVSRGLLLRFQTGNAGYIQFANENILVIVMIEQEEAVRNIEEIASVPGIDVLFVGSFDMSFSFNVGGQPGHPRVEEAILKVLAAAKKNNLVVGYPAASPEEINKRVRQGFRIFLVDSDLDLMQWGARALLSKIEGREISPPKPGTLY